MPSILTFRRGTAAQNDAFTGSAGELTVDTTNGTIRVHDGVTAGGSQVATASTLGELATQDTITESQISDFGTYLTPTGDGSQLTGIQSGLLQVKTYRKTSGWSSGNNGSNRVEVAPFDGTASITPSSTSSIIMAYVHIVVKHGTTWRSGVGRLQYSTDGGSSYSDFGMMTSTTYGDTNMSGNDYAGMFMIPNQNTTNAHKVRFYNMPHDQGYNHRLGSSSDTDVNDSANRNVFGTGATLTLFEYDGSVASLFTTA